MVLFTTILQQICQAHFKHNDLTCFRFVIRFAFLSTPQHLHPMWTHLFQACFSMRKQFIRNATLIWQYVLIVALRSLCWMYMIDFQVVKTCQKQIRRKTYHWVLLAFCACDLWAVRCDGNAGTWWMCCYGCLFVSESESMHWSHDQQWVGVQGWMWMFRLCM